jgi:hypothetical protein
VPKPSSKTIIARRSTFIRATFRRSREGFKTSLPCPACSTPNRPSRLERVMTRLPVMLITGVGPIVLGLLARYCFASASVGFLRCIAELALV